MAKTAVLFKSNYGGAKQYALYIANALDADLFDIGKAKNFDFEAYDTLIYGGGMYVNKVNGIKFVAGNADKLASKNLVIFTVGLGDPTVAANAQMILKGVNKSLPKEIMSRAHIYSFRGSLEFSELNFKHRMMMKMLRKMLRKKTETELTDDDRAILDSFDSKVDYTNMEAAAPLIEYVKSLSD